FGKSKDMAYLENHLSRAGFRVDNLELPLTFKNLIISERIIIEKIRSMKKSKADGYGEIILVGYGMGGLLVRKVIEDNNLRDTFLKIVLIASPTKTPKVFRKFRPLVKIMSWFFKPLKIYLNNQIENVNKLNGKDVGIVCGTEPGTKIFQPWLSTYNDGLYSRDEVSFDEDKSFQIISVPFCHRELHQKYGTAEYILDFIETGKFAINR
ncbi:MAG: esterase/lipase family protein, partial [Fusobacteriaceae bacterium]